MPHLDYEDLGIPVPPQPFDWSNPHTLASYLRYEDEATIFATLAEALPTLKEEERKMLAVSVAVAAYRKAQKN